MGEVGLVDENPSRPCLIREGWGSSVKTAGRSLQAWFIQESFVKRFFLIKFIESSGSELYNQGNSGNFTLRGSNADKHGNSELGVVP